MPDKTYTFYPPSTTREVQLTLVGCGGTGSHLADGLFALLMDLDDARRAGVALPEHALARHPLRLALVDPDHVEPRNLGRQRFVTADLGRNKAEVLATRYRRAYNLSSTFHPQPFDAAHHLAPPRHGTYQILVGCVDNAAARQAMHDALTPTVAYGSSNQQSAIALIDTGNARESGQVLLGTTARADHLRGSFLPIGACTALPAPALLNPTLLQADDAPSGPRDCAARVLAREQSFTINRHIADAALELLLHLFLGDLTWFGAYVTTHAGPQARALPLTPESVAAALGTTAAELQLAARPNPPARRQRAA